MYVHTYMYLLYTYVYIVGNNDTCMYIHTCIISTTVVIFSMQSCDMTCTDILRKYIVLGTVGKYTVYIR